MTDLAKLTEDAVGWELIAGAAKAHAQDARSRLLAAMQDARSLKQSAGKLGTVSLTGGEDTAEVYSAEAVLEWTRQHRPEMLIHLLNPKWLELLKAICIQEGQPIDPETGAIVPGIRRVTKPPGLLVRTTREAKEGARALIAEMAVGTLAIAPARKDDDEPHS
jgi:hypothetical protein